ncbi:hypothetical protein AA313_de0205330 [Arthrobotrys entomopaga]|nr:hypothetical protein AA313_de0205330 [Arthrobotrys entomopaga]
MIDGTPSSYSSSTARANSTSDEDAMTLANNPTAGSTSGTSYPPDSAATTTHSDSHDQIHTTPSGLLEPKSPAVPQLAAISSPYDGRDDGRDDGTAAQDEPEPPPHISERKPSILRPPLPPLPFHLREHKGAVAFCFCVMVIDHGIFPPACYFSLRYATDMSLTTIFGIVTAVFGIVLGIESLIRTVKLVVWSEQYRPLGQTSRWGMDFWQFSFTTFLIINVICVSVGTALNPPFIDLMAMPMPTIIFNMSWLLLLFDFLHDRKVRTPFRISSTPKGEIWPRFIYVIIEDVIAVDCNGKRGWRQAWKDRVQASKPMRETLKRLSFFWGIGGLCMSTLCFGLLWGFDSISGKQAGYALGWLLPWVWIIPSTLFTTWYVKKRLKDERHFCQRYKGSFSV